jgi:hypothetical protein
MSVPPGVSERDFARAVARFESVVGRDWVFTTDEDTALYRDAYSPFWNEAEEKQAAAAIAPESAEQVQEIVRMPMSSACLFIRYLPAGTWAMAAPRPCCRAASCST